MLKRWRGFPLQLFAFVILPLTVIFTGIAFGSLALHQQAMRTLVGERDERAARAVSAAITEQLNHLAASVRNLALQAATEDTEHALTDATSLLPDFEGGLAFFNSEGTLLAATNDAEAWEKRDISQLFSGSNVIDYSRNGVQIVSMFKDPMSRESFMLVAAPTPDGKVVVGAFSAANIARKALGDLFSTGDNAAAYLVDSGGQILYHLGAEPHADMDMVQYPGIGQALRGESGTTYVSAAGDEQVIAFSPIAPANWALVLEEPWRDVADPLLRTTELVPLILVPVLIVALVGLWFGVRKIVQPLQSLEQKATKLAWGDFEAIEEPVEGINEIQRLQTELIHMARKVKASQQSLRGYLSAVTTGQEEERRRLARELHDDTIQSLIALNQQGQLAQMALDDHPVLDQLIEMQAMTTQIIDDLRRLTRDLRPIYLEDLGLVPALDMLTRDIGAIMSIAVTFNSSGLEQRLLPDAELALYRIAQEALSNVVRHSTASKAALSLDFDQELIALKVVDNGRGFEVPESPADMAPNGHFGLLGMQERAELMGAHLAIESAPDQGTTVKVILPV